MANLPIDCVGFVLIWETFANVQDGGGTGAAMFMELGGGTGPTGAGLFICMLGCN